MSRALRPGAGARCAGASARRRTPTLPLLIAGGLALCGGAPGTAQLAVRGTVLDAAGRGLPNARVELLPLPSHRHAPQGSPAEGGSIEPAAGGRSDAGGRFELEVPEAGVWRLRLRPQGRPAIEYRPLVVVEAVELPAVVPAEEGQEPRTAAASPSPTLAPSPTFGRWTANPLAAPAAAGVAPAATLRVEGRILDARRGRPLAGALVWSDADAGGFVRSDAAGRYQLTVAAAGRLRLRAAAAGHLPGVFRIAERRRHAGRLRHEFRLLPARRVTGRVGGLDERPIAGATITLRAAVDAHPLPLAPTVEPPGKRRLRAVSDPTGRFVLPATPAPVVELEVHGTGYAPLVVQRLRLPPGDGPVDLGLLVLTPGATLEGRVLDREGRPIVEAAVHLLRHSDAAAAVAAAGIVPRLGPPQTTSGPGGRFVLGELRPGQPVSLCADAERHAPACIHGIEPPLGEPLRVVLAPTRTLAGRVENVAGEPVAGAEVSLSWQEVAPGAGGGPGPGAPAAVASTDPRGRFRFDEVGPGLATLEAVAPGYAPAGPRDLVVPAAGSVDEVVFVLDRGAVVAGRVADADGGPVAGARVEAEQWLATSTAEGWYRLEGVAPGPLTLEVLHPEHPRHREELEVLPGDNRLDVSLRPGRRVQGRVRDEERRPVAGAVVALRSVAGGGPSHRSRSRRDGSFELFPVTAGSYRLGASRRGYRDGELPAEVVVGEEEVTDLELTLARGAEIVGRIFGLEPEEMARVRVEALDDDGRGEPGRIDGQGGYSISGLAPGDWRVEASLAGGRRQARARVRLDAETGRAHCDLEFAEGLTLSGEVAFRGEPLSGAFVALRGSERAVERSGRTDYRGEFRFEDLDPGAYRLDLTSPRQGVVQSRGVSLDGDRHLLLEVGTARVSGRVLTASDYQAVADARVSLYRTADPSAGGELMLTAGTDARGVFVLPRVPPGDYRLSARKDGYSPVRDGLSIEAGLDLDGLELVLEPTQGLELTVRLASGAVPRSATVALLDPAGALVFEETRPLDAAGRGHFASLPAGSWRLLVAAPGGAVVAKTATVPATSLVATLPEAGRLEVQIPDLAGSDRYVSLRLFGLDGQPLRAIDGSGGLADRWRLIGGRGAIDGLPGGTWLVRAATTDGRVWEALAATSGGSTASVVLE